MSPEQCRCEPLDSRSDIYSLGVIVFQALAGEAPFTGDMAALMRKHVEEEAPLLSAKRADISQPVADLIGASLAKDPATRPGTAEAFASAFRATAEGEAQVLREAKAMYYTSQRLFFQLSLAIYVPFAIFSVSVSIALRNVLAKSTAAPLIFYLGLYVLVRFATRLSVAACTIASSEVRLRGPAAVKLRSILAAVRHKLPAIVATSTQAFLGIWAGLVKLVRPGARAYFDYALAPCVIAVEDPNPARALARSKELIGPLRQLATGLLARDFGIGLSSLLFFSFISLIMAGIFGEGVDTVRFVTSPALRNFIVVYCWFILTMMHTVYAAVPLVFLYFKARQARGESIVESGERDWNAETARRAGKLSRAAFLWMAVPLLMLALMIISSVTGFGSSEGSLIDAVRKGREQIIASKLAAGADPNSSRLGTSALMFAARDGQAGAITQLLAAGAGLDARDNDGDTPLMYAAIDGRTEAIKALLKAGADVNGANRAGNTPLLAAVQHGRTEAVRVLLAAGADPDAMNRKNQSPRSAAAEEGRTEIRELLN
jgi:hypothetical protein